MTCYAPLFASTANYKWTPNLIWFNPRDVMLTPNYFVQQMFAGNTGRYVLGGVSEDDPTTPAASSSLRTPPRPKCTRCA